MDSILLEKIIYGSFLEDALSRSKAGSRRRGVRSIEINDFAGPDEFEKAYRELVQHLFDYNAESEEILKETKFPRNHHTPDEVLFTVKSEPAYSEPVQVYLTYLLELEVYRLIWLLNEYVGETEHKIDRFYLVTLAMRKWTDYLADLNNTVKKVQNTPAGENGKFPTDILRRQLMVLLCDLSERYTDLDLKERYTRTEIYPLLLGLKAPEEPEIVVTPSFFEFKGKAVAEQILSNGIDEVTYRNFLNELKRSLPPDEQTKSLGDIKMALERVVHHTENLLLLTFWQTEGFIEKNRVMLKENRTAAEWVRSVRNEAKANVEKNSESSLKKLWKLREYLKSYFTFANNYGLISEDQVSEARLLLNELDEADRTLFQMPYNTLTEGDKQTRPIRNRAEENPFLDQLGEKFMSNEHLYDFLKIKHRNTRGDFLEKAGFRYVELTQQKHLVYIEDVEKYIEENTKRYGEEESP